MLLVGLVNLARLLHCGLPQSGLSCTSKALEGLLEHCTSGDGLLALNLRHVASEICGPVCLYVCISGAEEAD